MSKATLLIASSIGSLFVFLTISDLRADDKRPVVPTAETKSPTSTQPKTDAPKADALKEDAPKADDAVTGPEKALVDKGLKRDDRKFLLDEAASVDKYKQCKNLLEDYQKAMVRLNTMAQYDEGLQSMQMDQQALQEQVNMLNAQINGSNRAGIGRMRTLINAQLAPLRAQQAQAQQQLNQMNAQIKAAGAQAPKTLDRQVIPAEVEKTRNAYVAGVRELETMITPLLAKYHELHLDKSVLQALADMKRRNSLNYKLGPSDDLNAAAAMVKDVKRNAPSTKATTKGATKKKAKTKGS